MIAARMGRDRGKPLRQDWEQVKTDVMAGVWATGNTTCFVSGDRGMTG